MNGEAIGAVGEILGAIGVIVTLGYLASQTWEGLEDPDTLTEEERRRFAPPPSSARSSP